MCLYVTQHDVPKEHFWKGGNCIQICYKCSDDVYLRIGLWKYFLYILSCARANFTEIG